MRINPINSSCNNNNNVGFGARFHKGALEAIIKDSKKRDELNIPKLYTMVKHLGNTNSEEILTVRRNAGTLTGVMDSSYNIRTLVDGNMVASSREGWLKALGKATVGDSSEGKMSSDVFEKLSSVNKDKTAKDVLELGIDDKQIPDKCLLLIQE